MSEDLVIGRGLKLPKTFVTETCAILAKRGMGKTYTGKRMVEEMLRLGAQVCVIDPVGVWWGLRSNVSGKGAGYEVVIMGGDHGDLPLTPTSGEVVAQFVVDSRQSVVLDLSAMRKNQAKVFVTEFLEALYHLNRDALHVMIDEADEFAPQMSGGGPRGIEARMLGAMEDLVRRGRGRGLGCTMITQRPAVLNKNVLTQIEMLVVMRLVSHYDVKAVRAWVVLHATDEELEQLLADLPTLPVGRAWFWSPGWLKLFRPVSVSKLRTFDSSATPEVGTRVQRPTGRAEVDLDKLRAVMQGAIDEAASTDPKQLRKRLKAAEAEIAKLKAAAAAPSTPDPVLTLAQHREVMAAIEVINRAFASLEGRRTATEPPARPRGPEKGESARTGPPSAPEGQAGDPPEGLTKVADALLAALVPYPQGRSKAQVSILSGYSARSSTFSGGLTQLVDMGLIVREGGVYVATDLGREVKPSAPMPTGDALFELWLGKVGRCEKAILNALREFSELDRSELAERTGYSARSSTFSGAIATLKTLDLIAASVGGSTGPAVTLSLSEVLQ